MENLDFGTIIAIVMTGLTTFFGVFWGKIKSKLGKVAKMAREIYEAVDSIDKSMSDDKLTKEEILNIKKEIQDVQKAFKELIKKSE